MASFPQNNILDQRNVNDFQTTVINYAESYNLEKSQKFDFLKLSCKYHL